jgi:general secretion pathway protein J
VKGRSTGFTLLELLVAMMVFAVLATLAYQGISGALRAQAGVTEAQARWTALQRAQALFARDITQLVARPVRDARGDRQPALVARSGQLSLVRGGMPNPLDFPRSDLVRVNYRLVDGLWQRAASPVLDAAPGDAPEFATVLTGVSHAELLWLDDEGRWRADWPPPGEPPERLPRALRLRWELAGWGTLERHWVLP